MASVYKSLSRSSNKEDGPTAGSGAGKRNKQKVLMLTSRGVTYRHRHLLKDLHSLMPHSRMDTKLDTKYVLLLGSLYGGHMGEQSDKRCRTKLYQLNELAELYNCNNIVYFEMRKKQDCYMYVQGQRFKHEN